MSRLETLSPEWDLLVVGGGATGAATLREAARCGLRALLVEQRDFAWGTSSRSTKLAHGGLRYLDTGDVGLVRDSIRERDRLVRDGDGLARPLPFLLATSFSERLRYVKSLVGMKLYWLLGLKAPPPAVDAAALRAVGFAAPDDGVGLPYEEASIDDARLVLRLLAEARAPALNQVAVERVSQDGEVALHDRLTGTRRTLRAKAVVNATGIWTQQFRMRPLRGSHLLVPVARLPLKTAVSFRHPADRRWVCAVPWEDVVVIGTTDLDHPESLADEPRMSAGEFDYLVAAARSAFGVGAADVVSCISGVRAILDAGPGAPSAASREHVVRRDGCVVSVAGGKLTNCRQMALDALRELRLPVDEEARMFDAPPQRPPGVPEPLWARLAGRYGPRAAEVAALGELELVAGTQTCWAELRWALRHEQVHHLDDLLLRRVRIGLFLPEGAAAVLPRVQALCAEELGWDAARFSTESAAYQALWRSHYAPPKFGDTHLINGSSPANVRGAV